MIISVINLIVELVNMICSNLLELIKYTMMNIPLILITAFLTHKITHMTTLKQLLKKL